MKRGTPVHYRSISGTIYDAVTTEDVSPAGFVAIEIILPGGGGRMKFSRAKWRESETSEVTACWPRGLQNAAKI